MAWSVGLGRRVRREWLLVTAAMLVLTAALSWFSTPLGLSRLDHAFYDQSSSAITDTVADDDIVIVAIDDSSIAQLGYWPWRRALHAELLDRLRLARVVALDLLFTDLNPAYPHDDATLAAAISEHGRVILPVVAGADHAATLAPVPTLAASAAGIGYIDISPDSDGVVRRIAFTGKADNGPPHFTLAMLDIAGVDTSTDSSPSQLIPYVGPPGSFRMYPYAPVVTGLVPAEVFRDKYVLVGSWGSGLGDSFPVPVSNSGATMSGVEILANMLNSQIHGLWIQQPSAWVVALLSCLPVVLACVALGCLSPRRSFIASITLLLLIFLVDGLLLHYGQLWIPPTAALLGVALSYPVWTWRSQEAALQHIDQELQAMDVERRQLGDTIAERGGPTVGTTLPARIVQLQLAVTQLRVARQRREETVRFLSHDMRSPQNAILALTQLQRGHTGALPQPELLERIEGYAHKTLALVDGLVELARAESAPIPAQPVDLVAAALQGCDDFWGLARSRGIAIRLDDHPESAWTEGDPSLVARAWCNLLDNAIKYSFDHTAITCRIHREGAMWSMAVQDEGSGIEASQLEEVFQPFRRLPVSQQQSGAGLGLAFVKAVAERHGGSVRVSSRQPGGTRFSLSFPAV